MITKAIFENFKALRNVQVELAPLTVLVGPNGSGKSSILEALHYLSQATRKSPRDLFRGRRDPAYVFSRGAMGPLRIEAHGTLHSEQCAVAIVGRLVQPPDLDAPLGWTIEVGNGTHRTMHSGDNGTLEARESELAQWMSSAVLLRLEASRLAEPSFASNENPRVEFDGSGLASTLADLRVRDPDQFTAVEGAVAAVIPAVRKIRLERAKVFRTETEIVRIGDEERPFERRREYWGYKLVLDMVGADDIPAHCVSEGTLLVIGLMTVLHGPAPPRLILLDDLDRALHPVAQGELVKQLRRIMEANPVIQILGTSHSPYLLDHLRHEEVRLVVGKPDGSVACAGLGDHPDFDNWKAEMLPGEFWSMVGENWIAERMTTANG